MALWEKYSWNAVAVGIVVSTIAYLFVLPMRPVLARDVGQFQSRNPEIGLWIKNLKNKEGDGCCDTADGYPAEARWDAKGGRYNVFIKGEWVEVPESAVLTGPNKLGYAME